MQPKLTGREYTKAKDYLDALRDGRFPEGAASVETIVAAVLADAKPDDGRDEFLVTLRGEGFGNEDLCEDGPVESVVWSHGDLRFYTGGQPVHIESGCKSAAAVAEFIDAIHAAHRIPLVDEVAMLRAKTDSEAIKAGVIALGGEVNLDEPVIADPMLKNKELFRVNRVEYSHEKGLSYLTEEWVKDFKATRLAIPASQFLVVDTPSALKRIAAGVREAVSLDRAGVQREAVVLNRATSGGLDPLSGIWPAVSFRSDTVMVFESEREAFDALAECVERHRKAGNEDALRALEGVSPLRVTVPYGSRRSVSPDRVKTISRDEKLYLVHRIEWDVDEPEPGEDAPDLPQTFYVSVPAGVTDAAEVQELLEEVLDRQDFSHRGFSYERIPDEIPVRMQDGRFKVNAITGRVVEDADGRRCGVARDEETGEPAVVAVDLDEWRKFYDYLPDGHPESLDSLDLACFGVDGRGSDAEREIRQSGVAWMMCNAIADGDHDTLQGLAQRDGALVAARQIDGVTPAHVAAEHDDVDALKILHAAGCNLRDEDCTRRTPLSLAGPKAARWFQRIGRSVRTA